ncbi:hypothetical protein FIBSPDRAFT_30821 [Athelia psychrophila]|uniref:Uncharacterized protein n=1 Tax=Athelia psychrophila TaxID=1759441 RepID=A0A166G2T7_9AGAM|nr:hypothetical protein FIBSPDRAFT_30821 [Fibularhizoctonia sp. CBS 109695]
MYSLPTISIHHCHPAVPLYFPVKRIERLTRPATLPRCSSTRNPDPICGVSISASTLRNAATICQTES